LCIRFGSRGTVSLFGAQSGTEVVQGSLTSCIQLDTLRHEYTHSVIRLFRLAEWLERSEGKARILHRLSQASLDNFGDCEPVGEGILEMRIHYGPGFRVYFVRHGAAVYVLLCGGDKSSQRRDIARAKRMARELKESGR
jgi:putative addiction module killer protein